MIEIDKLTESDKGREVRYDAHEKYELGRITSWNERVVFVRYHLCYWRDGERPAVQRTGTTSEATSPSDLTFCNPN